MPTQPKLKRRPQNDFEASGMIEKLDAAARQLDCAIELVADGENAIPVHTLTMAAFGILNDLAKRHQHYERHLKPQFTKIGWSHLTRTASFLKHADRDPEASIPALDPRDTDWRIGFCLILYRFLCHTLTPMMGAFHQWMIIRHPDEFHLEPDADDEIEAAYRASMAFMRQQGRKVELETLQILIRFNHDGTISPDSNLSRQLK